MVVFHNYVISYSDITVLCIVLPMTCIGFSTLMTYPVYTLIILLH